MSNEKATIKLGDEDAEPVDKNLHRESADVLRTDDPPAQPKPISEKDAAKALYHYRGKGTISGVPARDLTVLDVERLTPDQLRAAIVAPPGGKALYDAV